MKFDKNQKKAIKAIASNLIEERKESLCSDEAYLLARVDLKQEIIKKLEGRKEKPHCEHEVFCSSGDCLAIRNHNLALDQSINIVREV